MGVILGLYRGCIGVILGLLYRGYIGIMEKKMEGGTCGRAIPNPMSM